MWLFVGFYCNNVLMSPWGYSCWNPLISSVRFPVLLCHYNYVKMLCHFQLCQKLKFLNFSIRLLLIGWIAFINIQLEKIIIRHFSEFSSDFFVYFFFQILENDILFLIEMCGLICILFLLCNACDMLYNIIRLKWFQLI